MMHQGLIPVEELYARISKLEQLVRDWRDHAGCADWSVPIDEYEKLCDRTVELGIEDD